MQAHWPVHKLVCGLLPQAGAGARAGERDGTPRGPADCAHARACGETAPAGGRSAMQQSPGLRELLNASCQAEAEEVWETQEAAGEASQLPRLHALIASEIATEAEYTNLASCIQSICKQWRAPPEHSLVSWYAAGKELREKVTTLLREFVQVIEGAGPFVAYADGPVRAVRCRATVIEQPTRLPPGEHLRRLLELVPDADTSWVLLSDDDSLWHPGRTAFFRNFARQVPGPDKCAATVAPLLAQPTSAEAAADESFASPLVVNKMLQQRHPAVVVKQELVDISQYCVRRSLLAAFFETQRRAVLEHELCLTRVLSFVARDHKARCLQVAPEQLAAPDGGGAPMWMIFCRRPDLLPRAASSVEAPAPDMQRAGEVLEAAGFAGGGAGLRRRVEQLVLRRWGGSDAREAAEAALDSFGAGPLPSPLLPLAEDLAKEAREAFGVEGNGGG